MLLRILWPLGVTLILLICTPEDYLAGGVKIVRELGAVEGMMPLTTFVSGTNETARVTLCSYLHALVMEHAQ